MSVISSSGNGGNLCTESVPFPADGSKVSLRNLLLCIETGTMLMFSMHVCLAKHFCQKLLDVVSFSVNNNVEILTRMYLIR